MDPALRPAALDPASGDPAACAAIYRPYVKDTSVSFEAEPPTAAQMRERMAGAVCWIVAELDEAVVGYAYATRHRERAAYRFACDVSVYLAAAHQGQGVGRRLYERLLAQLTARGFRMACAGIALPNEASVGLHTALGFQPVGVYRDIGWKHDRWHDVLWLQLPLGVSGPPTGEPR